MWKILIKTIPISIKKDIGTYSLMVLLVAAGMFIASATAGITYSYVVGCDNNSIASNSQDGQFQVRNKLTEEEENAIISKGYQLERAFYYDTYMPDGSTLRVMRTRQNIDKIVLDEGRLPQNDSEAVLDKCYAFHHELSVSDTINCAGKSLTITGVGSVTDYESPAIRMSDFSSDSISFGLIFITDNLYNNILENLGNNTRENCIYAYKLAKDASDDELREFIINDMNLMDNLMSFIPKDNNSRMELSKEDNYVYGFVGGVTGIGLMIMITMIFFLRIRYVLDSESPSIGALLAMGVQKSDIYPMILAPSAIASTIGGLLGFIMSRIFTLEDIGGSEGYYLIPKYQMITHPLIFLYCVIMPPLISIILNMILIRKKMSKPVVSLLKSTDDNNVSLADKLALKLSKDNVKSLLVWNHLLREKGVIAAILVGSLLSGAILMTGRGVGYYCKSVKDRLPYEIHYKYVYELLDDHETVPEDAYGAYKVVLLIPDHGFNRDIQFLGIENDNPYFDVDTTGLNGGIIISTAVASRYRLKVGDTFSVHDSLTQKPYSFEIKGTTDYSERLTVFMDIKDLRKLMGHENIAYNVNFSDVPLDYERSELIDASTKAMLMAPLITLEPEVTSSRDVFYDLSFLFYTIMMIYLMIFAVIRNRREIAVLSAFGYKSRELSFLFLGGLIAASVLISAVSLIVSYYFSWSMLPILIASTPIGLMIDYTLPEYLIHLLITLVIITVSLLLGMGRVAATDILYYLRSRE